MSEIEPNANDQIVIQLERLRAELVAAVWPAAIRVAEVADHERVCDLVKLKVDIEAVDFPTPIVRSWPGSSEVYE